MKQSPYAGKVPDFQKILFASAILHILFITLIAVPLRSKDREYKSYFVNLVGPVEIRRPAKTFTGRKRPAAKKLKEKTAQKAKTPAKSKPRPRRRVQPKKGVAMEPERPAQHVSKEIERLQALKALAARRKSLKDAEARSRQAKDDIARAIEGIKNKKQIRVTRSAGIPGAVTSTDTESYYAVVTEAIWSEWIYPDFDTSGLETIISIRINKKGVVISQFVEKSSGNVMFDRSAAKAIKKASPLPPPPIDMEIGVRFYL